MPKSASLRAALALLVIVGAVAAKEPLAECGSFFTKAQEEAFLHARNVLRRAATARLAADAASPGRGAIAQDFGDIAVIGDGNGVIGRTNPIDLSNTTLTFTPGAPGYTLTTAGNTYDAAAAAAPRVTLADDDTRRFDLPFPFAFFGATYTSAWVNSNGTLTFTRGDTNFEVQFGRLTAGPPAIAGLFTDLDPEASTNGVRVLAEAARFVVTWDRVPLAGGTQGHTAQIRLHADGRIEFAYGSVSPGSAVVGIVPGNLQPATLADLDKSNGIAVATGLAELFTSFPEVDVTYAAQRFYQTHDDAYDYLVFYNTSGITAGPGTVAYELTVRSSGEGYGDTAIQDGSAYGSKRRLQAVLNMGPLSQYPDNPDALVESRRIVGDTPLTLLGHEAGHLWLALTSVPHPSNALALPPMLGAGLAHWAFTFNSDASFMEGNRIEDTGSSSLRFRTTATVQHYSALDQYLMGFRAPEEVPSTFAVLNSGISNSRAPQTGISFNGQRLDIGVNDLAAAAGRRTPDATVAQRHFRFAFVLIVPEDSDLSPNGPVAQEVAKVEAYRSRWESFFAEKTDFRATADTSLRRASILSLNPNAGVVLGQQGRASILIEEPADQAIAYTIATPNGVLAAPGSATIPQGQTRAEFAVTGLRVGVEELVATPSDPRYHATRARVQVEAASALHVEIASGDRQTAIAGPLAQPIGIRVVDKNKLPYSNVRVVAEPSSGTSVESPAAITDENGMASFEWTTTAGSFNALALSVEGVPSSKAIAVAPGLPTVASGGIVNAASFGAGIAPDSFVTLFGGSLSGEGIATGAPPFPSTLAGAQVYVNGSPAALSFVSDFQINFITPANLAPGAATVTVTTPRGTSDPIPVQILPQAPGIFFNPASGYGAILIAGTTSRTQDRPARAGDYIEVYCTGLGSNPNVTATIGGVAVEATYAGESYLTGLQQVNLRIPSGISPGAQDLILTVNGSASNTVKVQIGQ